MFSIRHFCRRPPHFLLLLLNTAAGVRNALPIHVDAAQFSSPSRHSPTNTGDRLPLPTNKAADKNNRRSRVEQRQQQPTGDGGLQGPPSSSSGTKVTTTNTANRDQRKPPHSSAKSAKTKTIPLGEQGDLEEKWFPLDYSGNLMLKIRLNQKRNGQKYLQIAKLDKSHDSELHSKFLVFPLTNDVFSFVCGMDQLLAKLSSVSLQDAIASLPAETAASSDKEDKKDKKEAVSEVKLAKCNAEGTNCNYQLQIILRQKGAKNKKMLFTINTVESVKQQLQRKSMGIPLRALPWLRRQMADMSARYDGSQQLGPPPKIPDEFHKLLQY